MIICSNCGATNSEHDGAFCRKCGAPLPISKERSRINLTNIPGVGDQDKSNEKEKEHPQQQQTNRGRVPRNTNPNAEVQFFSGNQNSRAEEEASHSPEQRNLQTIPQNSEQENSQQETHRNHQTSRGQTVSQNSPPNEPQNRQTSQTQPTQQRQRQTNQDSDGFLKEITPKPFNEPVIQRREVYGPSKDQGSHDGQSTQPQSKPDIKPIPRQTGGQQQNSGNTSNQSAFTGATTTQQSEAPSPAHRSQKEIEEDMQDVLEVLSKKLVMPSQKSEETHDEEEKEKEKVEKKLPPQSMNDILKDLFKIDMHIEASAIVKGDGTILASAISNRVSDTLFATIGQTLSMIGIDIVDGLSAGKLKTISLKATKGILDLAPIGNEYKMTQGMFLILFSQPRVKSGVINIAVNNAKKQIKKYLGLEKKD
ncbi:MAG: hypothetical protein R6U96_03615 [Promethearchaeia archaeon]